MEKKWTVDTNLSMYNEGRGNEEQSLVLSFPPFVGIPDRRFHLTSTPLSFSQADIILE